MNPDKWVVDITKGNTPYIIPTVPVECNDCPFHCLPERDKDELLIPLFECMAFCLNGMDSYREQLSCKRVNHSLRPVDLTLITINASEAIN